MSGRKRGDDGREETKSGTGRDEGGGGGRKERKGRKEREERGRRGVKEGKKSEEEKKKRRGNLLGRGNRSVGREEGPPGPGERERISGLGEG